MCRKIWVSESDRGDQPCFGSKIELSFDGWSWNRIIETGILCIRFEKNMLRWHLIHIISTSSTWNGDLFTIVNMSHHLQTWSTQVGEGQGLIKRHILTMTKKRKKRKTIVIRHTEIFLMTNNVLRRSSNLELQLQPMFVEMMMEMNKDQRVTVNRVYQ